MEKNPQKKCNTDGIVNEEKLVLNAAYSLGPDGAPEIRVNMKIHFKGPNNFEIEKALLDVLVLDEKKNLYPYIQGQDLSVKPIVINTGEVQGKRAVDLENAVLALNGSGIYFTGGDYLEYWNNEPCRIPLENVALFASPSAKLKTDDNEGAGSGIIGPYGNKYDANVAYSFETEGIEKGLLSPDVVEIELKVHFTKEWAVEIDYVDIKVKARGEYIRSADDRLFHEKSTVSLIPAFQKLDSNLICTSKIDSPGHHDLWNAQLCLDPVEHIIKFSTGQFIYNSGETKKIQLNGMVLFKGKTMNK